MEVSYTLRNLTDVRQSYPIRLSGDDKHDVLFSAEPPKVNHYPIALRVNGERVLLVPTTVEPATELGEKPGPRA